MIKRTCLAFAFALFVAAAPAAQAQTIIDMTVARLMEQAQLHEGAARSIAPVPQGLLGLVPQPPPPLVELLTRLSHVTRQLAEQSAQERAVALNVMQTQTLPGLPPPDAATVQATLAVLVERSQILARTVEVCVGLANDAAARGDAPRAQVATRLGQSTAAVLPVVQREIAELVALLKRLTP